MAPSERRKKSPSILRQYQLALLAGVSTAVLASIACPALVQAETVVHGEHTITNDRTINDLLIVGKEENGTLTVLNNYQYYGLSTTGGIILGQNAGVQGKAIVQGEYGYWVNSPSQGQPLIIGDQGQGFIVIQQGGHFKHQNASSEVYIGRGTNSSGRITLTNDGSYFYAASGANLYFGFGDDSEGYIEILDGAFAETGSPMLGFGEKGYGEAIVSSGGTWHLWNTAYVGYSGVGYLEISSNGKVSLNEEEGRRNSLFVGYTETGDGTVKVSDGGVLDVGKDLNVGYEGTGTMEIIFGGEVRAIAAPSAWSGAPMAMSLFPARALPGR